MRPAPTAACCLLATVLLTATGCGQPLNYESTVQVPGFGVKSVSVGAPRGEQKATVSVSSPGAPVDVYVVVGAGQKAAEDALVKGGQPAGSAASREKVTDATLEVTIPAKTEFHVLLRNNGDKDADVKLSIKGK